jgi:hypothetical protein
VSEAEFFFEILSEDLIGLPQGATIVEVGSGVGLLSLMIAACGFEVHSYEPATSGFGEMRAFRNLILKCWEGVTPPVIWHDTAFRASESSTITAPDYALAVNVIEHVPAWELLVRDTVGLLNRQGRFRTICPNYAYPYEPHFNMPTLLNKRLTRMVFSGRIAVSSIDDAGKFWADLSWPTGVKIRRSARRLGFDVYFRRSSTLAYIDRVAEDPRFASRKAAGNGALLRATSELARPLLGHFPAYLMPVLDCTWSRLGLPRPT